MGYELIDSSGYSLLDSSGYRVLTSNPSACSCCSSSSSSGGGDTCSTCCGSDSTDIYDGSSPGVETPFRLAIQVLAHITWDEVEYTRPTVKLYDSYCTVYQSYFDDPETLFFGLYQRPDTTWVFRVAADADILTFVSAPDEYGCPPAGVEWELESASWSDYYDYNWIGADCRPDFSQQSWWAYQEDKSDWIDYVCALPDSVSIDLSAFSGYTGPYVSPITDYGVWDGTYTRQCCQFVDSTASSTTPEVYYLLYGIQVAYYDDGGGVYKVFNDCGHSTSGFESTGFADGDITCGSGYMIVTPLLSWYNIGGVLSCSWRLGFTGGISYVNPFGSPNDPTVGTYWRDGFEYNLLSATIPNSLVVS